MGGVLASAVGCLLWLPRPGPSTWGLTAAVTKLPPPLLDTSEASLEKRICDGAEQRGG